MIEQPTQNDQVEGSAPISSTTPRLAAVVPCYKVRRHILGVLEGLRGKVDRVYVVDDCCPEGTGTLVQSSAGYEDVIVLFHEVNQGVGGAVLSGYRKALEDGFEIVVKMDGDGQMDPVYLPALIAPIASGVADYTKGNRFFDIYGVGAMPTLRIFGNAGLSILTKMTSGYWDIMDPTNGFTAIHKTALDALPLDRLERRYLFEIDMLFRLSTIRAVVADVPMPAIYGGETSNLGVAEVLLEFPPKLIVRCFKRFFYMYLLRDFNIGTVEVISGLTSILFGTLFGLYHWYISIQTNQLTSTGTVMIAVLPIVIGFQLLLSGVSFDVANRPTSPLQGRAASVRAARETVDQRCRPG